MSPTRTRTARPLGWHPVSLRVAAGSPEAELLNRWAPVYGGRSAALRAGLAALAERDRLLAIIAEAAAALPLHPAGKYLTPAEDDGEEVRVYLLAALRGEA